MPLVEAIALTLLLFSLSAAVGTLIGVGSGWLRYKRIPFLSSISQWHCFFFRGSPLIVQFFLIYYGLAQFDLFRESFLWSLFRSPLWCAFFALTLNTSAYIGECFRGAFVAVPRDQIQSGIAFGMNSKTIFRRIFLPHAVRMAWPAYSNELVLLLKATSVASTITIVELTGWARSWIAETYLAVEIFAIVGLIYVGLNSVLIWSLKKSPWG